MTIFTSSRDRPLQQRDLLHDRIVLAITTMGLKSLEGRTPMVHHAPLHLVAGGRDGKINRPANQADTGDARASAACSDDIQQVLCDEGKHASSARQRANSC